MKINIFTPEYTHKFVQKSIPAFIVPAGLISKQINDNRNAISNGKNTFKTHIDYYTLLSHEDIHKNIDELLAFAGINPYDQNFRNRKKILLTKIRENKKLSEHISEKSINKINILLVEKFAEHPELMEITEVADSFKDLIRVDIFGFHFGKNNASTKGIKARACLLDKIMQYPVLLTMEPFRQNFYAILGNTYTQESFQVKADIIDKIMKERPELLKEEKFIHSFPIWLQFMFDKNFAQPHIDIMDMLFKNPEWKLDIMADIIANVTFQNISLAKELCNNPDFPKDKIADIVNATKEHNLSFSRELCNNPDFPKELIADIIKDIRVVIIPFTRELCYKPDFPKDKIANIVKYTHEGNLSLSRELCNDPDFPKDLIPNVLNATNQDNIERARELYHNHDIPPYMVSYILILEKDKSPDAKRLLSSELRPWLYANAENALPVGTLKVLLKTQEKINIKKKEKSHEQTLNTSSLSKEKQQLMAICGYENMAEYYLKLCELNGITDNEKYNAVLELAKKGISIKDCKNIMTIATGNNVSAQNGIFRTNIVNDILVILNCGIKSATLATYISAANNMTVTELTSRFNKDARKDFINKMNRLDDNIKINLGIFGFNIEEICEKSANKSKNINVLKIFKRQTQNTNLRRYSDIDGMEKAILDKFKNEIDEKIWQNPETFQQWAKTKFAEISDFNKNPNYIATDNRAKINAIRKQRLSDWYEYLTKKSHYKDDIFTLLFVMDGITKDMRPNNEISPPVVSHEIFEIIYNSLLEDISKENFGQIYTEQIKQKAIQEFGSGYELFDKIEGQWVSIPKSQKGYADYTKHLAMVMALSEGSCWCLKSEASAPGYLNIGNLDFFIDKDGKALLAITETDGVVKQIERRYKQDSNVPVPYATVINHWAEVNNYSFGMYDTKIKNALEAKPKFDKLKAEFAEIQIKIQEALKNGKNPTMLIFEIFKKLDFNPTLKEDGTIIIEKYTPILPDKYTLSDLGINENILMQYVSEIHSDLDLKGSRMTSAPHLKIITGTIIPGDNPANYFSALEMLDGHKITWI